MNELPELMTVKEVQQYLRISEKSAYQLLKSKGFPCIKIGGTYRVDKAKLIKWVNEQT